MRSTVCYRADTDRPVSVERQAASTPRGTGKTQRQTVTQDQYTGSLEWLKAHKNMHMHMHTHTHTHTHAQAHTLTQPCVHTLARNTHAHTHTHTNTHTDTCAHTN